MIGKARREGRPIYATRETIGELRDQILREAPESFIMTPDALAYRIHTSGPIPPLSPLRLRNDWERESTDPNAGKARESYYFLWLNRGMLYDRVGTRQEAIDAYERAERIRPGQKEVRDALDRLGG